MCSTVPTKWTLGAWETFSKDWPVRGRGAVSMSSTDSSQRCLVSVQSSLSRLLRPLSRIGIDLRCRMMRST